MPCLIGCILLSKIHLKVDIENDMPASTFIFIKNNFTSLSISKINLALLFT